MNGKTHQLIGFTSSLAFATIVHNTNNVSLPICAAIIAGSCLGSYIPDMDHPGSTLGRKICIISHPINLLSRVFLSIHKKTKWKIFLKLSEIFAHRGIFHAPIFWVAVIGLIFWKLRLLTNVTIMNSAILGILTGVSIGIGMHLFADMFNPTGIPILMPIVNKKISLGKIVTGSKSEWGVIAFCSFIVACNIAFIFLK